MRSFLLILALASQAGCAHRDPGSVVSTARDEQAMPFPTPVQVIEAVGLRDVDEPNFVAWTPRWDRVVLVGKRGTNYVAVVACAHPRQADHWRLPVARLRTNGSNQVIVGQWDYDHRPSYEEIDRFVRLLLRLDTTKGFVFEWGLLG